MASRKYQTEDLNKVRDHFYLGERRLLGVAATGLGKTHIFSHLYDVIPRRKKMLVIVNREELIEQSVASIKTANPDLMIGVEQAENRHSPMDDVVVASIQTIGGVKEDDDGDPLFNKRILTMNPDEFDVIIADECLAGDSLIQTSDGITRIDNSDLKGKLVLSYNELDKLWEYKKVTRWINQGKRLTIKITTEYGVIRCTANHPIMTRRGWVEAGSLTQADQVMIPIEHNGNYCTVWRKIKRAIAVVASRLTFQQRC